MNIIFLTEGGKNIGFGHITRCAALVQGFFEFAKKDKPEIDFIINGDRSIEPIIKNEIGKRHKARFRLEFVDWIKGIKKIESKIKSADCVVIDSYLAPKKIYDYFSRELKPWAKLICIDDYNRIKYPSGSIVVNPSIYGDKLKYPKDKKTKYLLGKDYIILRKAFWKDCAKKINKEIKNILITTGGMAREGFLRRLLGVLVKEYPDFIYYVVYPKEIIKNRNIRCYNSLPARKMRDLMCKADIAISGGGQTTYELVRVSVPTIGICFEENQRMNLEEWQNKKVIEYVGWGGEDKIYEKIADVIGILNAGGERLSRVEIGKRYVDGKGVGRIINEVSEIKSRLSNDRGGREEEPKNNNISLQKERELKICFMGGKQAGIIGMLTILARGYKIIAAVSYSDDLTNILNIFGIPLYKSINDKGFIRVLGESDVLLSVHGREIVKRELRLPKYGAINIHPYLYKYKGPNPVEKALRDGQFKASVGAHLMEEHIDRGKILVEEFIDVSGSNSVEEIYNRLYPYYAIVALKALDMIRNEHKD